MQSAKIKMTKRTASFAGLSCLSGTFFIFHFTFFSPLPYWQAGRAEKRHSIKGDWRRVNLTLSTGKGEAGAEPVKRVDSG